MTDIKVVDGKILLKYLKKGVEVEKTIDPKDTSDEIIGGIYTTTRNMVAHLIVSKGNWNNNVHSIIMPLVKELVEFAQGYKYINGRNKKKLVVTLITEIITKELEVADVEESIKELILQGVELVLEPAIDLAVFASGSIKLNKKALKKIFVCF